MTDERIDALLRRLDVASDPDPEFERSTYAALLSRARAARVTDASRIGSLQRDIRLIVAGARRQSVAAPLGVVGAVVLLILATIVAFAIVGAMNRSIPNGPLIVSVRGELQAVDTRDGSVRNILPPGNDTRGVSRSPDGRLVAFWTIDGGSARLYVVSVDGQDRRELGADLHLGWTDAIDTWSPDSRSLATEVVIGIGPARIVVADVVTGAARIVTPLGLAAHAPLWSLDGNWIAFAKQTGAFRSLAIIRTDGSGMRTISGDLSGVAGPDTWSPDGQWIYFSNNDGGIYRANVPGAFTQRLTGNDLAAFAPTSSPDGTLISFIVSRSDHWDLYVANSDGTGARQLLEHATNAGWSSDGRYVLAEWTPSDQPGGLAVIGPDGSGFRVVLPFGADCSSGSRQSCTEGVGWGQPRP
jgi:WD40 repeat protein